MLIREPKNDPHLAKEVKVKIPVGHHVRLHSMRVLTGKPISETVTEALEAYFVTHPVGRELELSDFHDGQTS